MLRSVRNWTGLVLALSLSCAVLVSAEETKEFEAGDLKLQVPESWKEVPKTSEFRLAEFSIPAREGEKETDAELVVFHFGAAGGGGIDPNIDRWKSQFDEKGREMKIVQGKGSQGKYVLVDLKGTWNKPVGPPILRRTEKVPGTRGLFVILSTESSGDYFLRLTGPDGLVKSQTDAYRTSFGGDATKEEEYKAK